MPADASEVTATIANAATESDVIPIARCHNVSIWMPAAWTAATLGLLFSRDGTNWKTLTDADGAVALPAAADAVLVLPASTLIPNGARFMKLVSSAAQGADRTIIVEKREFS